MRRINSLFGAAFRGWAAVGRSTKIWLCILVVVAIVGGAGPSLGLLHIILPNWPKLEKDVPAPIDYGYGPGKGIGPARPPWKLGQVPRKPPSRAKSGIKS